MNKTKAKRWYPKERPYDNTLHHCQISPTVPVIVKVNFTRSAGRKKNSGNWHSAKKEFLAGADKKHQFLKLSL